MTDKNDVEEKSRESEAWDLNKSQELEYRGLNKVQESEERPEQQNPEPELEERIILKNRITRTFESRIYNSLPLIRFVKTAADYGQNELYLDGIQRLVQGRSYSPQELNIVSNTEIERALKLWRDVYRDPEYLMALDKTIARLSEGRMSVERADPEDFSFKVKKNADYLRLKRNDGYARKFIFAGGCLPPFMFDDWVKEGGK